MKEYNPAGSFSYAASNKIMTSVPDSRFLARPDIIPYGPIKAVGRADYQSPTSGSESFVRAYNDAMNCLLKEIDSVKEISFVAPVNETYVHVYHPSTKDLSVNPDSETIVTLEMMAFTLPSREPND